MASMNEAGKMSFAQALRCVGALLPSGCLLTLSLASAGCTLVYRDELDKKQCKSQADCDVAAVQLGAPLVCRDEACQTPTCSQNAECPANSICMNNACVAGSADAGMSAVACTQDSDCGSAEKRCGFDGFCYVKWGCLSEELKWPAAPFELTYATRLISAENPGDPSSVRDTRIEMCATTDTRCERPVVSPAQVTIAADATVTMPLISGSSASYFVGVVRFTSAASDAGASKQIIPTYRLFTSETPLSSNMVDPVTISLLTRETLSLVSLASGITIDPAAGIVQAFVADCGGRPAPGMSVSVPSSPDSKFVPLAAGGPVQGATVTPIEGTGTLLNIPPDRLHTFLIRDEGEQRVVTNTLTATVHGAARDFIVYYPRMSALQKWLDEAKRRGLLQ